MSTITACGSFALYMYMTRDHGRGTCTCIYTDYYTCDLVDRGILTFDDNPQLLVNISANLLKCKCIN